jgi:predicted transcriptional regulator
MKKTFAVRLDDSIAEALEAVCEKQGKKNQQVLEEAAIEYVNRELRYLKGKEECRKALGKYLETGEVIDEDDMEDFVKEKLNAKGVKI